MNYAETLAYWYLRLNGFFPLANFVLHRPELPETHNADADILAVRFPNVFEEVGGREGDWDNERFDQWGLRHREGLVCLICEVKSGAYNRDDLDLPFGGPRLLYGVQRLGVVPQVEVEGLCDELLARPVVQRNGMTFGKLLVSARVLRVPAHAEQHPWLGLRLTECAQFIEARMRRYQQQKNAARMFFPNDLIQYFAWQASVRPGVENGEGVAPP